MPSIDLDSILDSDDSIFDTDCDEDEVVSSPPPAFSSSTHRFLPDWASPVDAGSEIGDYGAKYASSSGEVPSRGQFYTNYHPHRGAHSFPSYGADTQATSSRMHLNDDSRYSKENSSNGRVAKGSASVHFNNSRSTNPSQKEYEDHLTRYNNSSSRVHDIRNFHDSSGRGGFISKGDDDVVMLDRSGRILPPTLTRARPALPATSISVDPVLHAAMAEGPTGHDERLIYQAALQELLDRSRTTLSMFEVWRLFGSFVQSIQTPIFFLQSQSNR